MDVVLCIVAAIRHVLQGVAWDRAFDGCGFGLHGRSAGARLLKILERSAESVFFPPLEPSHAALLSILPRKRSYRLNLLLHTHWAPLPVPNYSKSLNFLSVTLLLDCYPTPRLIDSRLLCEFRTIQIQ